MMTCFVLSSALLNLICWKLGLEETSRLEYQNLQIYISLLSIWIIFGFKEQNWGDWFEVFVTKRRQVPSVPVLLSPTFLTTPPPQKSSQTSLDSRRAADLLSLMFNILQFRKRCIAILTNTFSNVDKYLNQPKIFPNYLHFSVQSWPSVFDVLSKAAFQISTTSSSWPFF